MTELTKLHYDLDGAEPSRGLLALPQGAGPFPGVLVMHNAMGQGAQVRERAQALAKLGYAALVTDMYGQGFYSEDPFVGGALMLALHEDPERLRNRVLQGFRALAAHPAVDSSRMAAIGFCFGGQCVLELARSGADVKAVVSYHGLLTTTLPATPAGIIARVAAYTGTLDPYAPPEHVAEFQREMAGAGADYHLTQFANGYHAFTDPAVANRSEIPGLRYDALLDKLSWAGTVALLEDALQPQ